MMLRKTVEAKITLPGFHRWEGAPPPYQYLADGHRHLFVIRVRQPITDDRQVEFIELANNVRHEITAEFCGTAASSPADFGTMSCEAIAEWILDRFPHVTWCSVHEDDENGSIVDRQLNFITLERSR